MNPLTGYPRGWFVVAYADAIGVGDVQRMKYFGQEMVAFRGQDGEVRLLDAYCPHLGAHLAVGGKVVDNTVECAFHAWRFDGAGQCVDIPYAKKIPKNACVRTWPVREKNGLVFVFHDRDGEPPDYEIPEIAEYGTEQWLPWSANTLRVKTHPKEIVENIADKAHFPTVHGTHVDEFDNVYDRHVAVQKTRGIAYPRGGGSDKFALTHTYYGPGYAITEMESFLSNKLMLAHTPIDEETLDLRFGVSLKIVGDLERTEGFAKQYVDNLTTGFHEDIQIWENKKYRDRPVFCDGDGPVGKLRRWYAQFYA